VKVREGGHVRTRRERALADGRAQRTNQDLIDVLCCVLHVAPSPRQAYCQPFKMGDLLPRPTTHVEVKVLLDEPFGPAVHAGVHRDHVEAPQVRVEQLGWRGRRSGVGHVRLLGCV
jgi:hypothetical protein